MKITTLINIKNLIGIQDDNIKRINAENMNSLNCIENAYLTIKEDKIINFGKMQDINLKDDNSEIIDLSGKSVMPAWNDSHTHLVYAQNREKEFVDKINGLSYEEIAAKGGGILNSAKMLGNASEEELFESASLRLEAVMRMGTGAIEIKSGYGLSVENEIKMLRVVKMLDEKYSLNIKSTFLGAHAIPSEYKNRKEAYIKLIIDEMIPNIAKEGLADYIDIFCEKNYFSVDDTDKILNTGANYSLKPKIHVNQFTSLGGIKKAIEYSAISVDHLEVLSDDDIKSLINTDTIPTLLPSCSFFINIPYANANKLLKNNISFALATDYNPGSSPNGNMNLVASLACIKMKIKPEAAINAGTLNGAYAMELSNITGSISKGKLANLIVTDNIPSYTFLAYSFGENHIYRVMNKGKWI